MSIPPVQANMTITSDCTKCCPRKFKLFCCFKKEEDEKTQQVAQKALPTQNDMGTAHGSHYSHVGTVTHIRTEEILVLSDQ